MSHEQCDMMEFWEESTDKLAAQFHIVILKIFSFAKKVLE